MQVEWSEKIAEACPYEYLYPEFLDHILPLGISSEQVRGRVLIEDFRLVAKIKEEIEKIRPSLVSTKV